MCGDMYQPLPIADIHELHLSTIIPQLAYPMQITTVTSWIESSCMVRMNGVDGTSPHNRTVAAIACVSNLEYMPDEMGT